MHLLRRIFSMNEFFEKQGRCVRMLSCKNSTSTTSGSSKCKNSTSVTSGSRNSDSRPILVSKIGFAICIASGYGYYLYYSKKSIYLSAANSMKNIEKTYPLYSLDEVRKHNSKENRIWVTYEDRVYDITDFVEQHPGGEIILTAAGNAIDPFWNLYAIHKKQHILDILETYRIGNISKLDSELNVESDPYSDEPLRSSIFIVNSQKPFNAEPPLPILVENFITPSDKFYVRNHLPVPQIDPDDYELEISGIGVATKTFSLEELKKFPKASVMATVMCAGNRRSDMTQVKPVKGLNWSAGAVGNAVWSGARLIDVLESCGFIYSEKIQHIQFEGLDTDVNNVPYGASVPIEKVLNRTSDIILAYEMNGEPLPPDHGYPIRVIIPGVVGARNVKWLGRIVLSAEESMSHWQQNDYKGFSPTVDWDTVDFKTSHAIQELPVISAICQPINGQTVAVRDGKVTVRGYAWSGGGCKIWRVDVTADQGQNWQAAKITNQENSKPGRTWSWALWEAEIPVNNIETKQVEIWAKAVDSNYNVQPEEFKNIWNLRGVLGNAYHRVRVKIEP